LTGGEPLVHPEFLRELAPELKRQGRRVHLETAGVHAAALEGLVEHLDHVSADVKLASTMEEGDFLGAHEKFYRRCVSAGADLCVKCVVTEGLTDGEFDAAIELVARSAPAALFVVQPVTPMRLEQTPVAPAHLQRLADRARARLARVRVIPQVHRLLGMP
jgi:organic radical activating enzyme